jgi:CBS domain-containing protein
LLPAYVKRVTTGEFLAPVRPGGAAVEPSRIPVKEAMDRSVLCLSEDQSLADAASLLVARDVGFITRGDIVRRLFGP